MSATATSPTSNPVEVSAVSDLVIRSYGRCCLHPYFFDRFYARFTAKSPVIGQMFAKTDMKQQMQALRSGISFLLQFAKGSGFAADKVTELGVSHAKNRLNVPPSMYPLWLDALLETIAECDDHYTLQTRVEWLTVLRLGVEKMSSMYDLPNAKPQSKSRASTI